MNRLSQIDPVISRYINVPFEYGVQDCVLFTARCIDAQFDSDWEARVRCHYAYSGTREALRLLKQGGGIESLVTHELGEPVPWSRCDPGDVILGTAMDRPDRLLGIQFSHHFVTVGPLGLVAMPMDFALKGWRLCHKLSTR